MKKNNDKKFEVVTLGVIITSILITLINNLGLSAYTGYLILPVSIMIVLYIIMLKLLNIKTNEKAYVFLIPIVLIILSNLVFNVDESNKFLNIFILPILLAVFLLKLVNFDMKITKNLIKWIIELFPSNLFGNLNNIKIPFKNEESKKHITNIAIGILSGLVIGSIIISLLSGADLYFKTFIDGVSGKIFKLFSFDNVAKSIIIFINSFIIIFSVFINLISKKNIKDTKLKDLSINKTIISTVLIVMNLAYLLFIISEISKLTTNFLNVPLNYTYAEYAREGFFQLLAVTSINFVITILVVSYNSKAEMNKLIKVLLTILVSFSIILIFNSYYRLILYICNYGFTIRRLQVALFLLMELVLFCLLYKKVFNKKEHDEFKLFSLILIITYILNIYLCNDIIVKYINMLINKG